jgi:hypothetical protein
MRNVLSEYNDCPWVPFTPKSYVVVKIMSSGGSLLRLTLFLQTLHRSPKSYVVVKIMSLLRLTLFLQTLHRSPKSYVVVKIMSSGGSLLHLTLFLQTLPRSLSRLMPVSPFTISNNCHPTIATLVSHCCSRFVSNKEIQYFTTMDSCITQQ